MLLFMEVLFILFLTAILFVVYGHERILSKKTLKKAILEEYWDGKERRKHTRFDEDLEVIYSIQKSSGKDFRARSINVSEGGMKITLDEKLSIGLEVNCKLIIPNMDKFAEMHGEVVWTEDSQEKNPSGKRFFCSGIRFIVLKEPNGHKLIDYIRSLSKESIAI